MEVGKNNRGVCWLTLKINRILIAAKGIPNIDSDFGICCSHWLIILFSIVLVSHEDLQFDILKKSVTYHWQSLRASTFELAFYFMDPEKDLED